MAPFCLELQGNSAVHLPLPFQSRGTPGIWGCPPPSLLVGENLDLPFPVLRRPRQLGLGTRFMLMSRKINKYAWTGV